MVEIFKDDGGWGRDDVWVDDRTQYVLWHKSSVPLGPERNYIKLSVGRSTTEKGVVKAI